MATSAAAPVDDEEDTEGKNAGGTQQSRSERIIAARDKAQGVKK
jgi:hypothetical protein